MNWRSPPFKSLNSISLMTELFKQLSILFIYFIALYFSSWVSNYLETVAQSSAIYLPAGIKLAFMVMMPSRFWPTLWLTSRLYAAYLGIYYNSEWEIDLFHGFLQELTYMAVIYSFKKSRWPPTINSNLGVISLILLASLTASIKWFLFSSAFEFTTWLAGKQLLQYKLNMALGDLSGALLLTPLFLLISKNYKTAFTQNKALISSSILILITIYIFTYLNRSDLYPLIRLCSLLPIIWFSHRLGVTGAILSAFVTNSLIITEAAIHQDVTNTYISQLFILANSVIGLLVGAATNELKLKNNELQENNKKLTALLQKNKQLAKRMVTVQENERKYLSQELHDELGQNLTALKTDLTVLSIAQRNKQSALVEGLQQNAKAMYDSVYQIMHHLRPRELDELGLELALKEGLFKSLLSKVSIQYEVEYTLEVTLSDNHQTAIYRICQEAITNCIKHSTATQLRINLTSIDNHISLVIHDNGTNKEKPTESGGYGLSLIEERVIALDGKYSIDERNGFKIEIIFKL